jgi:hypothetical protein
MTPTRSGGPSLTTADSHVRGVDVIHIRDGLVAESLAYLKG